MAHKIETVWLAILGGGTWLFSLLAYNLIIGLNTASGLLAMGCSLGGLWFATSVIPESKH